MLLIAADKGPQQTLSGLSKYPGFIWQKNILALSRPLELMDISKKNGFSGIVVGTSRSEDGRYLERSCCLAARQFGMLVVSIEDYPFNFNMNNLEFVDLLIVESNYVKKQYLNKTSSLIGRIDEGSLIRYGEIRQGMPLTDNPKPATRILWIGQPETLGCLNTLIRIMPHIRSLNLKLDFKAHPNDLGYFSGNSYASLLYDYNGCIDDVSSFNLDDCIERKPFLVITQFSSLAIEVGFKGIPTLHLLYEDVGGALFNKMYGRRMPVMCEVAASLMINNTGQELAILKQLKLDQDYRMDLIKSFRNYYDVENVESKLIHRIASLISQ